EGGLSVFLERAKGFEPSTPTLARLCSTPELHPHPKTPRRQSRRENAMPKGSPLCNGHGRGAMVAGRSIAARRPKPTVLQSPPVVEPPTQWPPPPTISLRSSTGSAL